MLFLVKKLGFDWVDWCEQNIPVIKDRISYKNSIKLADESEIPDPEAMDITYLAHVLRSLADDAMKEHVKVVKDVRNDLCHKFTEAMDEELFEQTCEKLLLAFEKIIEPAVDRKQRQKLMNDLESYADLEAIERLVIRVFAIKAYHVKFNLMFKRNFEPFDTQKLRQRLRQRHPLPLQ